MEEQVRLDYVILHDPHQLMKRAPVIFPCNDKGEVLGNEMAKVLVVLGHLPVGNIHGTGGREGGTEAPVLTSDEGMFLTENGNLLCRGKLLYEAADVSWLLFL